MFTPIVKMLTPGMISPMQTPSSAIEISNQHATRPALVHTVAWSLLMLSPVVFALLTWPHWLATDGAIRHFSLPIVAIEVIVVVLAMIAGMEPLSDIARAPRPVRIAAAVLAAVALGTAMFVAPDRLSAMLRTCNSFIHVLFGLSLVHLFRGAWLPLRAITWQSLVVGLLGYCLLLACFVHSIHDVATFNWFEFDLAVTNVRQLGFYTAVGACAALGLAIGETSLIRYWAWLGASSILLAVSFWSGTRSSLMSILFAYGIAGWTYPAVRRLKAIGGLMAGSLTGLCISFIYRVPDPAYGMFRMVTSSTQARDLSSGRVKMWLGTIQSIFDHPIFGIGESQFRVLVPASGWAYNHPHNIVLQVALQWGLVGAACYFPIGAVILVHFQRTSRRMGTAALPAYLTVMSLLTYSMYEGTLYHPYPIAMMLVGVAWVISSEPRASLTAANPSLVPRAATLPGRASLTPAD